MTVEQHMGQMARPGPNSPLLPTTKRALPGTLRSLKNCKTRWIHNQVPRCPLCGELGGFNHTAAGCQVALHQGRYSWRHDTVLKLLGNRISQTLSSKLQTEWTMTILLLRVFKVRGREHNPYRTCVHSKAGTPKSKINQMEKTTDATMAWDKPPQLKNPQKGKTTVATTAWDKPPQLKSFPKATSSN